MSGWRYAQFLTLVLSIWAAMHAYVFARLGGVPWIQQQLSRRGLILLAFLFWAAYPVARLLESTRFFPAARLLEYLAANWVGTLFLLFAALLAVDVLTLGGFFFPRLAAQLRGGAVVAALVLAVFALIQGHRPPVLREQEVTLPGLPREHDGLQAVQISDLHLGTLIGRNWLRRLVNRVNGMRPDIVFAVGDVVDSNILRVEPLLPELNRLRAPLGVWVALGNHEFYAGADRCAELFERAGFQVLRDAAAEAAPGLTIAGVDDLTARGLRGPAGQAAVDQALGQRRAGGVILLSHTPWEARAAAARGAGLMLCGHTHNGQIWPFSYLVQSRYPLLGGRYDFEGITVLVCRGSGTWGPRMRLWYPSELVRITLRSPEAPGR